MSNVVDFKKRKVVEAILSVQVYVDCPHCGEFLDLLDCFDTDGVCHDDDQAITKQVFPIGNFMETYKNFEVGDVTCYACKNTFDVKELIW